MKPFSLNVVLNYRQRLKDIARNRFQKAQDQQNIVKNKLESQIAEHLALIETQTRLQVSGIDILEHIRYENRIELLKTKIVELRDQLRKKQEKVVRERAHLMKKSKEHRVLEKLKEKQNTEWQLFLDKKEAAMLDEIAILYRNR